MSERKPLLGSAVPVSKSTNMAPSEEGNGLKRRVLTRIKKSYNIKSLLAVKPIEYFLEERESRPEGSSLAERLGLIDLLGYGVGSTVGAGIYSLIGIGAGIAGDLIRIPSILHFISIRAWDIVVFSDRCNICCIHCSSIL